MGYAQQNTIFLEVKMNIQHYAYSVSYIKALNIQKEENKEKLLSLEKRIYEIFPDKKLLNIIFYRNDFHNLKVIMKNKDKEYEDLKNLFIYPWVYNPEEIYRHIKKGRINLLPIGLAIAAKKAEPSLSEEKFQLAEFLIDKEAMDFSLREAIKYNNKFLTDLIILENTLRDIKIALRCAKYKISAHTALSEKSHLNRYDLVKLSLSGVEDVKKYISSKGYEFDDFESFYEMKIKDFFQKHRYIFFGIEPVIYSIYQIEAELKE